MTNNTDNKSIIDSERLRVLDIFTGCGGMSFGFHRVGYLILGGIPCQAFAKIGNAVPPLMAYSLAKQIQKLLSQVLLKQE